MVMSRITLGRRVSAWRGAAVLLAVFLVAPAPSNLRAASAFSLSPVSPRAGGRCRAGMGEDVVRRGERWVEATPHHLGTAVQQGPSHSGGGAAAALRASWRSSSRDRCAGKLSMIANSPIDVAKREVDEPRAAASSASPSQRPLLPAERDINTAMNGFNAGVVNLLKGLMVQYYGERTYARFYALETIARVPYFGYLCVLHLYETLGQWRQAEYLKVHFAESYNELHHLLIMEELGGNALFRDRWFAQHAAFFYFFVVVGLYLSNPRNAYNLNQHVEEHAFSTYDSFLSDNEEMLKQQPAPMVAKKYYGEDKLYVFNGLHNGPSGLTFEESDHMRPAISNLFDTFVAVRNDEWEHVKTMKALQKDVSLER
ncbi:unnamed protein product [Pylaiella littoralis]